MSHSPSSGSSEEGNNSPPSQLDLSPPTSPHKLSPPSSPKNQSPATSPRISPPTSPEVLPVSDSDSGSDGPWPLKRLRVFSNDKNYVERSTLRRREALAKNDNIATHSVAPVHPAHQPAHQPAWDSSDDVEDHAPHSPVDLSSGRDSSRSSSETEDEFSARSEASTVSACSDVAEDTDSDNSEFEDDTLLFGDASVTVDEAILGIMDLYIKEHWTKKSLSKTLEYVRSLLPEPNNLPSSLHKLFKYVESLAPPPEATKHYYCTACLKLQKKRRSKCKQCDEDCDSGSFFVFSLSSQIRFYFEHKNLASAIDTYSDTEFDGICDVKSGLEFINIQSQLEGNTYDIILLWNTDGVQISKSSKLKLWPVLCTISQVPPHLRSKFLLVAGVWCDTKDPNMNEYLKPFVDSLKDLSTSGVSWTHPQTKIVHKSLVVAPALIADAPAKADVLNVMRFNSKYGCNLCEQKTKRIDLNPVGVALPRHQRKKRVRSYVYQEDTADLRTTERMEEQAMIAEAQKKPCRGVLGRATVKNIPYFDTGKSVCAEYMHLILLGVVKYFVKLIMFKQGPWYIGDKEEEINNFIKSIKVPDYINRCPRDFSLFKFWKAAEFLFFLLYYSLPVFSKYLKDDYYQHWMLLVRATYILLKERISQADLQVAGILLRCFVRDVGPLYGWQYYPYNVHSLLHICLQVQRWGSLWATSAFPFENFNGVLRDSIHGTKHSGQELINNIRISQGVQILRNQVKGYQKQFEKNNQGTVMFTNVVSHPDLTTEEISLLRNAGYEPSELTFYLRVKAKKVIFTSQEYDKNKRKSNSWIKYNLEGSDRYGQIKYFVKTADKPLCLVNHFKIKQVEVIHHFESQQVLDHLVPVEATNIRVLLCLKNLKIKLIKAGQFLCIPPNSFEINF